MAINPFDILKNAQKIQEQMGSFQEKLGGITETGSAGGGMVEIEMNGRMEVLEVRILPEAAADTDMLQDLVAAAFTSAIDKIRGALNREMGALMGLAGGMGFPGGFPGFGTGAS
ncbi:MAG: YbaB/EbfC family nucleoid-associated protein [Treponema sp.]|jgi:DNA-binding YbaB/EbfC family protein|nr:YbaB/EbfC family nucleoid-associated protein [Treponema sp.]